MPTAHRHTPAAPAVRGHEGRRLSTLLAFLGVYTLIAASPGRGTALISEESLRTGAPAS